MSVPNPKDLMISIIIPVSKDPLNLKKCLKAVQDSHYSNYECIVIDDGAHDDTFAVTQQFPFKVIRLPVNNGPAYARNRGVKAASGDILFFIDADVVVYPDTLGKIAEIFTTHPEIAAVIGSYDDSPADTAFISQYKNLFHHYVHQNSNVSAHTFWAGCGAIRREVFKQIGGFNERYQRPAIEDIELGFRLKANNYKILLQKQLRVKHLKRWTFLRLLKTDIFDRGIPWTTLMLAQRSFPNDLNVSLSQRVCVFLFYLFAISLVISALYPKYLFFVALSILAAILLINIRFYRFFVQRRGLLFTLKAVPLHLMYYSYSGLSFLIGFLGYYKGMARLK